MTSQRDGICVQYGCGLSAPEGWLNFDSSPTLRLQRLPFVGRTLARGRIQFPTNVRFGDVVRGLPVGSGTCRAAYASHVLEHLSREDYPKALAETYRILRPGGRFRMVVPDLAALAERYLVSVRQGNCDANDRFMKNSHLGVEMQPSGVIELAQSMLGNSRHLWMWDEPSIATSLKAAGFSEPRRAYFGDSEEPAFFECEDAGRFEGAVAFEARK